VSVCISDEWLFDGQPLPVSFVCELEEHTVGFEEGKAKMSFSVPVGTLIAVFVLALVAGVLAAVFPARRAARLNPLEALHYE
jgi:ABC-type antimicrobial peptide transport system permease subunit